MPRYLKSTEKEKATEAVKKFAKSGFSKAQMARDNGVSVQAVSKMIKRPAVQEVLQETRDKYLNLAGITAKRVYEKLSEELEAEKTIGASILVDKDGKVVRAEDEGVISVPDWAARDKAIDKSLKLMGHLDPDRETNINIGDNRVQEINITMHIPQDRLQASGGIQEITV